MNFKFPALSTAHTFENKDLPNCEFSAQIDLYKEVIFLTLFFE